MRAAPMLFCALAILSAFHATRAQTSSTPEPTAPEPVIRSSVREVLLDVIVRNKRIALKKNLRQADVTVLEDEVPQTIKTFRFVDGREGRLSPDPPSAPQPPTAEAATFRAPTAVRELSFVSVVLGHLGSDSRKNALDAANAFLSQQFWPGTYVSILGLGTRLGVLHGFSNNPAELKAAIRKGASVNNNELAKSSANVRNQSNYSVTGGPGGVSVSPSTDPRSNPDLAIAGAQASLSEGATALATLVAGQREMMMHDEGMRTMLALQDLVRAVAALPGRKIVLYISEGIQVPPARRDLMRNLISARESLAREFLFSGCARADDGQFRSAFARTSRGCGRCECPATEHDDFTGAGARRRHGTPVPVRKYVPQYGSTRVGHRRLRDFRY